MIYVVLIIAVIVLMVIIAQKRIKKNNQKLQLLGFDPSKKIDTGKYVAGHPDLNNPLKITAIFPHSDALKIFEYPYGDVSSMPVEKGTIPNSSIKNVLAEDETTIEKKVTVGRLLAVGVFAFALKAKKKNELAYLTIQWNDGRFDHETYFEFEGTGAMQKANIARNNIIKFVR